MCCQGFCFPSQHQKRRSSHTVKANNPVSKDFCAKCPRGIQTGMWLQVIFTHSILLCSISLLNWFLSLEQKGWAVGVVSHWNRGGRCSTSVGSFYKDSLQMKIKTTEVCNKFNHFSGRFLRDLSSFTYRKLQSRRWPPLRCLSMTTLLHVATCGKLKYGRCR